MSRIEKKELLPSPQSTIHDEVIQPFEKRKDKTRGRCSCMLIVLLGMGLFAGFIAWQMAATGLVSIPIFSSLAFHDAKPVRVVEAGIPAEQLSQSVFTSTLAKRLQTGDGTLTDRSIALALPESSLTASIQRQLKNMGENMIDVAHAQMVVLQNQTLEFFLPIRFGQKTTALLIRFSLVARGGLFDLNLLDVKLGSLRIPTMLIASFIQPFVNRELTTLNQALSTYMRVDTITTQNGILNASGTFTVEIKK